MKQITLEQKIQTGERIRLCREAMNLRQHNIADYLDISENAVSMFETGTTMCSLPNLLQLSELFDVSLDYLLKGNKKVTSDEILLHCIMRLPEKAKKNLIGFIDTMANSA